MNESTLKYELNHVWEVIAPDVLQGMEECGEEPVCDKQDVAEFICDFYRTYASEEVAAYLEPMSFDEKMSTIKSCLSFERYGW